LSIILKILSLGITIRVSTASFNFCKPSIAFSSLFLPSKEKGFVTTQTVKIHISFANCAITGLAPVQVQPPIPAVINTISVSSKCLLISSKFSSAAFLHTSGFAPAPKPLVKFKPIFIFVEAKLFSNACASVFTAINSTQSNHS